MNNTLNSIFVRLDVGLQYLSSKALAQIIVKLLYMKNARMKKSAIYEAVASINGYGHIGKVEIDEILGKNPVRERPHDHADENTEKTRLERL